MISPVVLLASAFAYSIVALVLSATSLVVSTSFRWSEYRLRRAARIAVDPGDRRSMADSWEVELWLTNVGSSHARLVRVWLEDEDGQHVSKITRLPRPLLAGAASEFVKLDVPKNDRRTLRVRPVRQWRDARRAGDSEPDPSDQWIQLDSDSSGAAM